MKENRTIMIADDDEHVRKLFVSYFNTVLPEINIIQAKNGKEAADKLEEISQICPPDAILTDFNMPVMNGLELLKFIRNHSDPRIKNLRVVMLTGEVTRQLRECATGLNCQLFEKPARFAEICSALDGVKK